MQPDEIINIISEKRAITKQELLHGGFKGWNTAKEKRFTRTALIQLLFESGLKYKEIKKLFNFKTEGAVSNQLTKHRDFIRFDFKEPAYKKLYNELKLSVQ